MLSVGRRLIVALLALAMTSQIVQGELRLCSGMDMQIQTSGQSMPAGEHDEHVPHPATGAAPGVASLVHSTDLDCVPSPGCRNAPALPVIPVPGSGDEGKASSAVTSPGAERSLAIRPELPPPRV